MYKGQKSAALMALSVVSYFALHTFLGIDWPKPTRSINIERRLNWFALPKRLPFNDSFDLKSAIPSLTITDLNSLFKLFHRRAFNHIFYFLVIAGFWVCDSCCHSGFYEEKQKIEKATNRQILVRSGEGKRRKSPK